jgi:hypothetical protein
VANGEEPSAQKLLSDLRHVPDALDTGTEDEDPAPRYSRYLKFKLRITFK